MRTAVSLLTFPSRYPAGQRRGTPLFVSIPACQHHGGKKKSHSPYTRAGAISKFYCDIGGEMMNSRELALFLPEVRAGGRCQTLDFMELEKEKGITITSAATTYFGTIRKINIIDTPRDPFPAVLDGAILVTVCSIRCAVSSITVDRQMKRYKVPDWRSSINGQNGANPPKRYCVIFAEKLKLNAVMIQLPSARKIIFEGVIDLVAMKAYYFDGPKGETIITKDIPDNYKTQAAQAQGYFEETIHAAIRKVYVAGICAGTGYAKQRRHAGKHTDGQKNSYLGG
ncbi:hypothetical protein CHS0354_002099, partial [Potamilus streckersoni]